MRLNTTADQEREISRAEESDTIHSFKRSVNELSRVIDQLDAKITEQSIEIVRLKSKMTTNAQKTHS